MVSGCATADSETGYSSKENCFNIRQISSWSAIDRDHVYLKEGVNNHYLVTLFSSCPGLRNANAIALSNSMGRMCPNDFGRITFRDAGMRSSCRIDDIEKVESKDAAVSLAEARIEATED
jgi:hypothetical protein